MDISDSPQYKLALSVLSRVKKLVPRNSYRVENEIVGGT